MQGRAGAVAIDERAGREAAAEHSASEGRGLRNDERVSGERQRLEVEVLGEEVALARKQQEAWRRVHRRTVSGGQPPLHVRRVERTKVDATAFSVPRRLVEEVPAIGQEPGQTSGLIADESCNRVTGTGALPGLDETRHNCSVT